MYMQSLHREGQPTAEAERGYNRVLSWAPPVQLKPISPAAFPNFQGEKTDYTCSEIKQPRAPERRKAKGDEVKMGPRTHTGLDRTDSCRLLKSVNFILEQ